MKRYYFPDDIIDQLHTPDRILQHLLLKIIKPTFKYVLSSNCHHIIGPSGVQRATERICQVLYDQKPKYFIRADIKSYYSSIVHYKLIEDIKNSYDDCNLIKMLSNIISKPIETTRGILNPYTGIALRGPLSQFFSGLYLKSLDDTMQKMDITYLRYQDDILILCKTKRQLDRCRHKMIKILYERGLKLSRRKTRMGKIELGFHFYTDTMHLNNKSFVANRIMPHSRTLRRAPENIKHMVTDGVSRPKIRSYLFRWLCWWARTSKAWKRSALLTWLRESCWDKGLKQIATETYQHYFKKLNPELAAVPLDWAE